MSLLISTTCLLLAGEFLVRDVSRQVGVQHRAEGQAVIPAAAEVCDVNVLKKKIASKIKKEGARRYHQSKDQLFLSAHMFLR